MQPVIRVENLSKEYRLGTVSHGTLSRDLQSWWARVRGKEDPNSLLGHNSLAGNTHHLSIKSHHDENPHFLALNDVSFDVQQGDVVGIIGRNGAGKSTLLKILSQVTAPSAGTVKIKGRVASLLEVGTGFHPELTGRENVFLNGAILGMNKVEIQRKFDEILAFSEIEKFIDTPVKRYSSGMYVRLAFAVSAHLEPEILIVDEVLAVGDALFQKKCLGKMQEIGKEGRTVLFVSHNLTAVSNLCRRGILLANGTVVAQGPIDGIVTKYLQSGNEEGCAAKEVAIDTAEPYQLLALGIMDASGQVINRPLRTSESFYLCLTYKMDKPLPGGYAVFLIKNRLGDIVLLSDSRDHADSCSFEEAQCVSIKIRIPAPLLVPGYYRVSATLARPPLGTVAGGEEVAFEVVDPEGVRQERAGYIYQPVVWSKV